MFLKLCGIYFLIPFVFTFIVKRNAVYNEDTILCTSDTDDLTGFCSTESSCADQEGRSIGSCSQVSFW